jgi:hypothetical protein
MYVSKYVKERGSHSTSKNQKNQTRCMFARKESWREEKEEEVSNKAQMGLGGAGK